MDNEWPTPFGPISDPPVFGELYLLKYFRGFIYFISHAIKNWLKNVTTLEQSELNWICHHQKELRSDVYQDIRNAVHNEENPDAVDRGKCVILPSSWQPTPHVSALSGFNGHCRKPDLFFTMTTNPKWPEITDALLKDPTPDSKRQEPSDRSDIVACVFVQKMEKLLKDVRGGLFGKVAGMVYTVEFQKRGLPHIHLLIFLQQQDKIRNPEDVDDIVSAQIPDHVAHPFLYESVTRHMVHGPCGPGHKTAACMVDNACSSIIQNSLNQRLSLDTVAIPNMLDLTMVGLVWTGGVIFMTIGILFPIILISQPSMVSLPSHSYFSI